MNEIIQFANKHGYETAEFIGLYNGAKAYSAIYRDDEEIYFIGLPAIILEKNNSIEWVQGEKSMEILNYFYPDE